MASTSPPANPPRLTFGKLVLRSLRFHARAHLGVVLGAMVGSAALIGALVVGDSVRGSLRDQALERLGATHYALTLPDRFVTEGLAKRMPGWLRDSWHSDPDTWVYYATKPAGVLTLPALASSQDQSARANRVNLIGVGYDPEAAQRNDYISFWNFAPNHQPIEIHPGEVWLNETLSAHLSAKPGDTLIFRVHKPSALSRETPITPRADTSVALRLRVAGIRDAAALGNFSLRASQTPPFNAFMNLGELQRATALEEKVNVLVSAGVMLNQTKDSSLTANLLRKIGLAKLANQSNQGKLAYQSTSETLEDFARDLKAHARLEDFQAAVRPASGNALELFSRRIFLEPQLAEAAPAGTNAQPILTYLVNLLRHDERATPYSMVTAAGAPWTPTDMRDDEILVNEWLAADLRAKPGDTVELSYYVVDAGSQLLERTNRFRVRAVVPLSGLYADRTLMPEFPGLAKAESTHDWDAGFPLIHKIRDEDEAYWKQHRGTPKAFLTLAAGQKMWSNRFGSLTAIRFPISTGMSVENAKSALEAKMTAAVDPAQLGLRFEPVREQALAAVAQAQDFGQLFLGFSFFVILAALILMALLFQFGLEQRTAEIGTLLALGFTPKQVRRLLLSEGVLLALLGGILGVAGGIFYARAMLHGLTTLWRDAVGTSALQYHATPTTLLIGLLSSVVVSAITIALVLRKQARRPARELLAEGMESENSDLKSRRTSKGKWIALPAGLSALAIVGWALRGGETAAAGAFFGAGALLLWPGWASWPCFSPR